jgi:hypothetical protein
MKCWHIRAWDELYESAQSRDVKTLSFYSKPNKLVGEGLGFTLAQENGLALLGTWALLESLASHGLPRQRGWLFRNGSPLDVARMSALLRIPKEPIDAALRHFSTPPMDWLEEAEISVCPDRSGTLLPARSQHAPSNSARGRTDLIKTDDSGERDREEMGGHLSAEELRSRQTQQFAAAQARLKALEAVPEEERSEKNRAELKAMKSLVRKIQKKQAHGKFTPVEEVAS